MSEDIIQEIWNKGMAQTRELSIEQIEEALRPHARRQTFSIRLNIWIWLVLLLGTVVVDVFNIAGYSSNPVMLTIQIGLTILAAAFGIYGISLLREVRIIDRADESMMELLKRLLQFYRTKFEIWNLMMAGALVLMTFAVTSYVDNENGYYRIGRVWLFVTFLAGQFTFAYIINKIGQYPFRKEMKILLSDLEANTVDGTQTIPSLRKRWRIWFTIFFIIGIVFFLYGIWRAVQFLP